MGTELTKDMLNSLIEIGSSLSISLLMALAILIIGRQLVKLILRLITVALEKSNVEDTVRIFVTNLLNTLLMILVFIAAINQLGIETTSIIAVLGAAGLAIGLALQGSLANFAAGILIVIYRPYKVADYIEAGNYAGTVKDIQIFSTVLKTPDNKIVVVPNGSIMNGSIVNYSDQDTRRIDLIVSCGYEDDIDKVFQNASKVVAVHSEDEAILNVNKKLIKKGDVHTHPVWRSVECAMSSTRRIVRIAEKYKKKAHILHVTTKEEIDFLSQHKGNITFEITPQHLTLYSPDCYDKLGTYAQMNPPLRDKSHYDRLWYGVKNNFNDTIGSDHAPHLKVNKEKEYPNSPSGMPGVQTLMPVMLNHVNDGKLSLNQLINLVCENPVKIFGIKNKGFIKEGYDADFTIVDMNKTIEIKNANIESKCGWSPFDGYKFKGSPIATIINGKIKMKDGKIIGEPDGKPMKFK